jgi:hypothetical protein
MSKPLWVYPEGHEPDWLDMSGDDRDPHLRIMELEAEIRNKAAEVWWLRGLLAAGAVLAIAVTRFI